MIALGALELARGRWTGAILVGAALAWGLYYGARYGRQPNSEEAAQINTENAKTSGLSRLRNRR